jgi:hypothetical protein
MRFLCQTQTEKKCNSYSLIDVNVSVKTAKQETTFTQGTAQKYYLKNNQHLKKRKNPNTKWKNT